MSIQTLHNKSIAFVGGGNMASAIIAGLLVADKQHALGLQILVIDPNTDKQSDWLAKGVAFDTPDNMARISKCDIVVLAIKPQVFAQVAPSIAPYVANALVVSVLAGVSVASLSEQLGTTRMVRCMPNLPASIGQGASGLFAHLSQDDKDQAGAIMGSVGVVIWVDDEEKLHAVTAVSGSAPAYFFYVLEAMIAQAVAMGLSHDDAKLLASQSMIGAGMLAQQGDPSTLRTQVTSKGGTTQMALQTLSEENVDKAFAKAMQACAKRSQELARIE